MKPEQAVHLLALITELYATTGALAEENAELKALLGEPVPVGTESPQ